jgi:Asp-tRNA(Asn)/Glu-tRNA(Gln) amidotransferase A subunit family amidase
MNTDNLPLQSATQLRLLRTRQISAVELAQAHIDQITRLNPAINAFADYDPDRVLAQAHALDASFDASPGKSGPLHGLPVTVKSSISAAGYRCEIGSTIHRGSIPTEDAPVVARLRAAGALILGTTNCPEFLMAYETDNQLHGRTANPWNLDYSPGGSSGGEAAAIAACCSAAGLGSDSGGSVRQPAHFTGICALKPTPGRIPGRGHLPPCVGPFSTLGAIGPMARTVQDLQLLFNTLSGPDPLDSITTPPQSHLNPKQPSLSELRTLPIGYFEDDNRIPVTPETRLAVQSAAQALREAGFRVEPFRPRSLEPLRQLWLKLFLQCGALFYAPTILGQRHQLSPIFREFLSLAKDRGQLTTSELLFAWAELDVLRSKMIQEMQAYPILLCPVASIPAFRHGQRSWTLPALQSSGVSETARPQAPTTEVAYLDAMRHTQWFNVLAGPATVVPVGKSLEGLPIGVQIAARPWQDETVLAIAQILDQNFGYHPPPLATGN